MDHRADIPLLTVLRDSTVCPKTFPKEKPSDPARPVQPVSNTSGALFTHSLLPLRSPPFWICLSQLLAESLTPKALEPHRAAIVCPAAPPLRPNHLVSMNHCLSVLAGFTVLVTWQ